MGYAAGKTSLLVIAHTGIIKSTRVIEGPNEERRRTQKNLGCNFVKYDIGSLRLDARPFHSTDHKPYDTIPYHSIIFS